MITPVKLAAELTRRGYPTTTRALRDWYSNKRGLIPKPKRVGRGPNKGVARGWDRGIVDQATLIASILAVHRDTDTALVAEWLLGYDVTLRRLKQAWASEASGLNKQLSNLQIKYPKRGDRAHHLGTVARRKVERLRNVRIDTTSANEATEFLLNAEESPDSEQLLLMVSGFLLSFPELQRKFDNPKNRRRLPVSFDSIRRAMDHELIASVIAGATHTELRHAHKIWRSLSKFARALFPDFLGLPQNGLSEGDQYIVAFGRPIMPQLILRGREGKAESIRRKLRITLKQVRPLSNAKMAALSSGYEPKRKEIKEWISLFHFLEIIRAILPEIKNTKSKTA